jgi:hypothetical protein
MAFVESEKEQLLTSLMDMRRQGQSAEIDLRFQQRTADADALKEANKRLTKQIDALLGRLMREWLGTAATAMTDLGNTSAALEAATADIKKKIAIAQNVVKAVGLLDDAVAIAKKALAGGI